MIEINAEIRANQISEKTFSINLSSYLFCDGVHGINESKNFVFVKKASDKNVIQTRLEDLVNFSGSCKKKIYNLIQKDLKIYTNTHILKQEASGAEEIFTNPLKNFNLTDNAIIFHFEVYEIGSRAEVEFDVSIPYSAYQCAYQKIVQ